MVFVLAFAKLSHQCKRYLSFPFLGIASDTLRQLAPLCSAIHASRSTIIQKTPALFAECPAADWQAIDSRPARRSGQASSLPQRLAVLCCPEESLLLMLARRK